MVNYTRHELIFSIPGESTRRAFRVSVIFFRNGPFEKRILK